MAVSAWVLLGGCAAHPASDVEPPRPDREVRYSLTWDDREIGSETVAVTVESRWIRWEGTLVQREPVASELSWTVLVDPEGADLVGFEADYRLAGETVRLQGWREGGEIRLDHRALGRRRSGAIAHGPNTVVDVGSPLSSWWAWSALDADAAREGRRLRAVVVRAPSWWPRVEPIRVRRGDEVWRVEGPGDERTTLTEGDRHFPQVIRTARPAWDRELVRERVAPRTQSSF